VGQVIGQAQRAGWLASALGASAIVVAYGNLATMATWQPAHWPVVPAVGHPVLVVVALVWARGPAGLSWADLGLARAGWRRAALLGLAVGGLMALVVIGLVLLARIIEWSSATAYPEPPDRAAFGFVVLQLLISTALCEELWFRGLLQACWVRLLGPWRGIVVVAVLFAVWHLAVWGWTLGRVTLQPALPLALTYPAGLLILGFAGVLFGGLRQLGGHLAGPIAAHWLIDVALVVLVLSGWL
jgi:membrane protease YdiL (CAAX protease family)